ncbi:MAG TPA: amidase [Acidobacteriota bacterium]|nr:amidase [Acidobacteriota bacterium]
MDQLIFASATELAQAIRAKDVSSEEVVSAHLHRIQTINPKLNAFTEVFAEQALTQARQADQSLAQGTLLGPLHGVPISVKDVFDIAGVRTVTGSRLRETTVATTDAPVVTAVKRAGAVILGKTNVPECGLDYRSENLVFGRTSNPWDLSRVPGGSSGGEAAAIASGCSPIGLGSDLGGSIRVPSHFCGIAGLNPTPGRISSLGHFPTVLGPMSLGFSAGPMARRIDDLSLLFQIMVEADPRDPATVPLSARTGDTPVNGGLKVMWYASDGVTPVTAETAASVEQAAALLGEQGFETVHHKPAGVERGFELWFYFLGQSSVPLLLNMYKGKEDLMGPLMQGLLHIIQPMSFEQFLTVWIERDLLRRSVLNELGDNGVLLCPVAATPAFSHDQQDKFEINQHKVDYLQAFTYAQIYNLLGLPSVVVRCGKSPEGLPIGVQIVGRPFEEEKVLAVARVLENAGGGYQRPPL